MPQAEPRPPPNHKRRITRAAREQFREELLGIARRVFTKEGYAAVTIRRITTEAGVTPMAFYWYFDCKEALLTVIWDEILQEAAQACTGLVGATPGCESMLRYCDAQIDFWLNRPDHFRAIFFGDAQHADLKDYRTQLQRMPGAQQVYRDLGNVLCPPEQSLPDSVRRMRTALVIYRLMGFLHSLIDMQKTTVAATTPHREWLRDDLRHTFVQWHSQDCAATPSAIFKPIC